MKIVRAYPPNIDAIAAVFPMAMNRGILFSWGDTIYNPGGDEIHPALIAHEEVHGARQLLTMGGTEVWWQYYLTDPAFRFEEERLAHIREYQWWQYRGNRNERRAYLNLIAQRLASPLYGNMISRSKAETLLRKGTTHVAV